MGAIKVHDLQAYRNMEITTERISFTFDPRDMLLSLQMGFSFVRAAVVCAIHDEDDLLSQVYCLNHGFNFINLDLPNYCALGLPYHRTTRPSPTDLT